MNRSVPVFFLRILAPRDFFIVGGEPVEIIPGNQSNEKHDPRLPMVGTVLRRSWKGRTILVEVLPEGFRYEGRRYSSLSNIAVEITGTRWLGFAFFGLTRAVKKAHAYGVVSYAYDSNNQLTALTDFGKGNQGKFPRAGVILDKAGNLYGTTTSGGGGCHYCGTVFKITP